MDTDGQSFWKKPKKALEQNDSKQSTSQNGTNTFSQLGE